MNKAIMLTALMVISSTAAADNPVSYNSTDKTLEYKEGNTTKTINITGAKGDKGDKGDAGNTGSQGNTGAQGATGETGAQGTQGNTGNTGAQGDKGEQGGQGSDGSNGVNGTDGINGSTGVSGVDGMAGSDGTTGKAGVDGIDGLSLTAAALSFQGDGIGVGVSGGKVPNQISVVVGKQLGQQGRLIFGITHDDRSDRTRATVGIGWSF